MPSAREWSCDICFQASWYIWKSFLKRGEALVWTEIVRGALWILKQTRIIGELAFVRL